MLCVVVCMLTNRSMKSKLQYLQVLLYHLQANQNQNQDQEQLGEAEMRQSP